MQLERIVKRRTLADGYLASDGLKSSLKLLLGFYALHAFFLAMSFIYTAFSAPAPDSAIGQFIVGFQASFAVTVLLYLLILIAVYSLSILALKLASSTDSPITSLLVSILSLLLHAPALLISGMAIVAWIASIQIDQQLTSMNAFLANPMAPIVVAAVIDFLVLTVLLVFAVGRSYRSLAAALRRVPGRYEYSYGTTAMSSSQRPSEVSFMERALQTTGGYTQDDAEIMFEGSDRYLIRFLHRNGKVVAASLQDRSSRRLMALFPGRESKSLNLSILLEDSYILQKEIRSEAQGTLAVDSSVAEVAEAEGWTVSSDGDSLLNIRRE